MNSQRYNFKVWGGRFLYVQGVIAAGILLALGLSGPSYAADTIKGGRLYASNCALCHGTSGISVMPGAPNFARGDGMLRPDMSLLAAIRSGKNAMPAFQGMLTDRDIMDVIAYLRTLH
jgi:cytochrome c6